METTHYSMSYIFSLPTASRNLGWLWVVFGYILKASIVSALSALALKPSDSDLGALQQLLVDQPNIPKEEGM
ncbi:Uncharacterized protein LOK49_LG09G02685 [Camellia lanceoleosa]|uniref:Uncharacterized protein n=1 Tax=Camellia lanceoleosa TaxID=1840588 RepID=A0ACC0GKX8_9ERIC|nr:Uncharacterized protein LOK49_LG09G02685 [Camellia lanceoleosa]